MRAEMGKDPSRAPPSQLKLPAGFRFYPTDEELVVHYLCKKAACEPFAVPIIAEVELYKFDPWDLPERALFGEKEWYFFSPRDRKYPNGSRPNRAAGAGYWKATGTDKPIHTLGGAKKVGVKKALVFYKGKAPKGVKTNWIMHEYRLADSAARSAKRKGTLRLDDWVLCRIYKKCSSSAQKSAALEAKERSDDQEQESSIDDGCLPVPNRLLEEEDQEVALPEIDSFFPADLSKYMEEQLRPSGGCPPAAQMGGLPMSRYGYGYTAAPMSAQMVPNMNSSSSAEFSHRDSPPESTSCLDDAADSAFKTSLAGFHTAQQQQQQLSFQRPPQLSLDNINMGGGLLSSPSALLGNFSSDPDFLYSPDFFNFQRSFSYLHHRI